MARILDQRLNFDGLTGTSEMSFTIDTAGMNQMELDKLFRTNNPISMADAVCGWDRPAKKKKKDPMAIKNVEFNPPLTIVVWEDGTKTFVKCNEHDTYDPEKGLAMAIVKKAMGNQFKSTNVIDKWVEKKWTKEKYASVVFDAADFYDEVVLDFPTSQFACEMVPDLERGETVLRVKSRGNHDKK